MSGKDLSFKLGITSDSLSSRSGLVLFGEYVNRLCLLNYADDLFGLPGSNIGYKSSEYLLPLLLKFHGGGRHLEDIRELKSDKALIDLLEMEHISSSAALGSWLYKHGNNNGQEYLSMINRRVLSTALSSESLEEYTLDIDATEIISGKRTASYSYKKNKGYMPIVGHLAENGMIVGSEFRSGNTSPSTRNYEFMLNCINNMPSGKRISSFRADSASYQSDIVNYCESNDISYAIGGRLDSVTKELISNIPQSQWSSYYNGKFNSDDEIAEIDHIMEETPKAFRLIIKRKLISDDLLGKEYSYHLIISNKKLQTAEEIANWYNQRGETSENQIKELKLGYNLEKLPCNDHNANALYFYIGHLAYNLGVMFKNNILPEEFRKSKISTIRWRLYQIAAKCVKTARGLYCKVQTQHLELFQTIRLKIIKAPPIYI